MSRHPASPFSSTSTFRRRNLILFRVVRSRLAVAGKKEDLRAFLLDRASATSSIGQVFNIVAKKVFLIGSKDTAETVELEEISR